ncbi:hypothetical protein BKP37_00750 [Anaerobacillus alkalilacustris]|uniref:DUF3168 domain-containing protein n=1 Tax=Anaerobacillus alkalilacustris TaxID=393763 RepID=A0A1S2LXY8_9BACI|nr:DUF3168 domain-containing protein [Anaerobacillus alkalilacustris]OIJ17100.1 hypothetical protein BKP37_00750 [Anaerobacillus alkalilacustris]
MIKLRKELLSLLNALHPRVYYQDAPDNAQYPYIVFDFPTSSFDGGGLEVVTVDIDGWARPKDGDTTELELLMEKIKDIDKTTCSNDGFAATFYLENRLALTDDDKKIKRRKFIFQARVFDRS